MKKIIYYNFDIVKGKVAFALCLSSLATIIFFACSKKDDIVFQPAPLPSIETTTPSQEVMMQAFYWNSTPGGVWWGTLETKLSSWKSAGITAIWLPVISKGASGASSMGYDPYDYFDFGQYNQKGSVETRFGSAAELTSLISNAKTKGFKLIADIVINHNSGGDFEFSPYSNVSYYTKFTTQSGKFNRNYEDFHPSAIDASDEGSFGGFPDICHNITYVKDWLYNRTDGIGKYYRDSLKFDGWRFDYVKGFSPNVVKAWNAEVGGISIGEYYDGNVGLVNSWCVAANSGAFDFPLMFSLKDALESKTLTKLSGAGLISVNPSRAYTFVANHDIDQISFANKLSAYAFILTAEGIPFIFYSDYETVLDKGKLNILISIKKTLAAGSTTELFSSASEYIFRRNGTPGLVSYFNVGGADAQRKVQTTWANKILKDYTGINPDVTTDANGYVTIHCKANGYSVYSPK